MSRKINQKERFARRKNFFGSTWRKVPVDPIRWKRQKREAYHSLGMRGDEYAWHLEMQYRADNSGFW